MQLALQKAAGRVLSINAEGTKLQQLPSAAKDHARERALGSTKTPPLCYLCKGTSLTTYVCYLLARFLFTQCQKGT